jgi:hypothetical protein
MQNPLALESIIASAIRYLCLQKTSNDTGSFSAFKQELKGASKKSEISPVSECKKFCSELL